MVKYSLLATVFGRFNKKTELKGLRGFTLAEVLISLVIIGVIAAMTIPTLINNAREQEYISRLKKAYATVSQVTTRIITDEGMPRGDIGGWATSAEAVFNMYKKYLSNVKVCGVDTTGCFQGPYMHYNGAMAPDLDDGRYTLVMADGAELSMESSSNFSADCSKNIQGTNGVCQLMLIDINGAKGPNRVGKDAFSFSLKADGLVPTGCDSNPGYSSGWGLTCRAIKEGAINYY